MANYLVTGGSNGIGKALIDILKQDKNNQVFNIDFIEPENKNDAKFIKTDLTKEQDIQKALASLKDVSFDGIFLNAGVLIKGSIFDIEVQDIKKVFDVNIWSNIYLIKGLKENISNGASIVFNGSDQCFVAKSNSFAYTTSKGAIAQMTKSLAIDLAKDNVRVNAVCPGTVDTDFYRNLIQRYAQNVGISFEQAHKGEEEEFPLQRIAQPEEVANLVYFLFSDKSKFMTGGLIPIDGGYTAQ
ncbi:SDR family oxidoreductase [Francisella sp. 19X1-34]|uniref:SDR family NAD(P)-dependent oxidoreductase n=1 Tax=Francisella sp. 19X1-34 TaxID=3087177 RepID=UPI002E363191|nr:SDR family oxidoreductase [Francisella sp. 19X1-34]MED7788531.1 SDR family oxidoreductase [Francisella sp. 19X1-34]